MSVLWRCPACGMERRGSEMTPYQHVHDAQVVPFERDRPVEPPKPRRGRPARS